MSHNYSEYIQQPNQEALFSTSDLGCSAALISTGFELVDLDKANPRKVLFIFEKRIGIEETVNEYWSGKLQLNARGLFDNIKMLKNRLYSN